MKIAMIGKGRMGTLVERKVREAGHQPSALEEADVCIEFTQPSAVVDNVAQACQYRCPIVVGTTGWGDDLDKVQALIEDADGALLYGPNFSIGMYLFSRILRYGASILKHFPEYDVGGIELHHSGKRDAPSGSAHRLSELLTERLEREKPVGFASLRLGSVYGEHSVLFDGPHETITATHRAKSREGFAEGALAAAEYIVGKRGIYTFDDYMEERIQWGFQELSPRS